MIETSLITYLLNDSSITDLVGTRIKFSNLSNNMTLPAMLITKISTRPINRMKSRAKEFKSSFQFDIFAESLIESLNIAQKVRLSLDGFSGTMSSTRVDSITFIDESDDYEPELQNARVFQEFEIYHDDN